MKILPILKQNHTVKIFKNTNNICISNQNFTGEIEDSFEKQEKKKSDDIKSFLNDMLNQNRTLIKQGHAHLSIIKKYYKKGQKHDYNGYIDFNTKQKEKILFNDFDEQNKIPRVVSLFKTDKGFQLYRKYDLNMGNLCSIQDFSQPNVIITMQMIKDRIIHYREINKNTFETKELTPVNKNEFYYIEGRINLENDKTIPYIEAYLNLKDSSKSYYIEYKDDKAYEYKYNRQNGLWQVI